MFIVPHGAPEGYEWFVALVVLVGLYFAVRNFMRATKSSANGWREIELRDGFGLGGFLVARLHAAEHLGALAQ
jgi:hypothetical protein